ncbi:MAG: hypothetical protein UHP28_04220 [Treponema sp.]|nr:hypothetical protein [Treponema sp.]
MKRKLIIMLFSIIPFMVFSQENTEVLESGAVQEKSESHELKKIDWNFDLTTDLAYYFKSEYKSGGHHFAQMTGPFSAVEVRTTFNANCRIAAPLGDHFLLSGANVVVAGGVELSPLTLMPMLSVSWSPVPFLTFSTGASFGIGWNIADLKGIAYLEDEESGLSGEYEDLTTLKNNYYNFWGKGTFQFDTGALIPGDWTHVLLVASYQVIYKGMTGVDDGNLWIWQTGTNYANGLQFFASALVGYQMPLPLRRVGIMIDASGHYKNEDYGAYSRKDYDGKFVFMNITPFVQIDFSKSDSLMVLGYFSNRQSFDQEHDSSDEEPYLSSKGHEWFFRRVAFRWQHFF